MLFLDPHIRQGLGLRHLSNACTYNIFGNLIIHSSAPTAGHYKFRTSQGILLTRLTASKASSWLPVQCASSIRNATRRRASFPLFGRVRPPDHGYYQTRPLGGCANKIQLKAKLEPRDDGEGYDSHSVGELISRDGSSEITAVENLQGAENRRLDNLTDNLSEGHENKDMPSSSTVKDDQDMALTEGSLSSTGVDDHDIALADGSLQLQETTKTGENKEKQRRARISAANKGRPPWNKGKKWSDEVKETIRKRTKQAMSSPKVREKLSLHRDATHSMETRAKIQLTLKTMWHNKKELQKLQNEVVKEWKEGVAEAARQGYGNDLELEYGSRGARVKKVTFVKVKEFIPKDPYPIPKTGGKHSDEHRKKISDAIRAKWTDEEYRQKVVDGSIQDRKTRKVRNVRDPTGAGPRMKIPEQTEMERLELIENVDRVFVNMVMASENRNAEPKVRRVKIVSRKETAAVDPLQAENDIELPRGTQTGVKSSDKHVRGAEVDIQVTSSEVMPDARMKAPGMRPDEPRESGVSEDDKGDRLLLQGTAEDGINEVMQDMSEGQGEDSMQLDRLLMAHQQRRSMNQQWEEMIEKARMLMYEAERAANALEAVGPSDEDAMETLVETRCLLAEAARNLAVAEAEFSGDSLANLYFNARPRMSGNSSSPSKGDGSGAISPPSLTGGDDSGAISPSSFISGDDSSPTSLLGKVPLRSHRGVLQGAKSVEALQHLAEQLGLSYEYLSNLGPGQFEAVHEALVSELRGQSTARLGESGTQALLEKDDVGDGWTPSAGEGVNDHADGTLTRELSDIYKIDADLD